MPFHNPFGDQFKGSFLAKDSHISVIFVGLSRLCSWILILALTKAFATTSTLVSRVTAALFSKVSVRVSGNCRSSRQIRCNLMNSRTANSITQALNKAFPNRHFSLLPPQQSVFSYLNPVKAVGAARARSNRRPVNSAAFTPPTIVPFTSHSFPRLHNNCDM